MRKFVSLFRTAPVRTDYADSADLFRVFCIAMIAWFHIWQQSWQNPNFTIFGRTVELYPVVTCGYIFVDSMLMLSGFLLMLGYLNGRNCDPRNFLTSRVARIVPCYYFFLLVQGIVFICTGTGFFDLRSGIIDTLSHLTFTQNLFPEGYTGSKFNGVLWTLAVEFQFYLFFPYLGRAFKKHPVRVWAVMTALAFFSRWYVTSYYEDTSLYFNRLPAMLDVYANGMMAAVIWVKLSKREPSDLRAWIATLIAAACCVAIYHIAKGQRQISDYAAIRRHQMDIRFMLSVTGAVLLTAAGQSIMLIRKLFSNPVTRFLSGISFNFYMWHQYIAVNLKALHIPPYTSESPNVNSEAPWQTQYSLLCFAAGIAVAALLTYLIEKPCARLIKTRFLLDKKKNIRYNIKHQISETKKG